MKRLFFNIYICAVFAASIFCFLFSIANEDKIITQAMIPFAFAVVLLIFFRSIFVERELSLTVLLILYVATMRYVVTPLSWYVSGMPRLLYSDKTTASILLTIYEMLIVFIVLYIKVPWNWENRLTHDLSMNDTSNVGTFSIIVFLIITLIMYPQYLTRLFTISIEQMEEVQIVSSVQGLFNLGYIAGWIALFCIAMDVIRRKSSNALLFALIVAGVFAWIISMGTGGHFSRTSFKNYGIIIILVVFCLFPEKKKTVFMVAAPTLFFVLLAGTVARFAIDPDNAFQSIFSYNSMNAYYSGIENVNVALSMDRSSYSVSTFFNDIFSSFPFLATRLGIDFTNRTTYIFNAAYFAGGYNSVSRICPLIGQGVVYFTPIFAPILDVIFINFSLKFENKARNSANMLEYFALLLITIYTAGFLASNINNLMNGWQNRVLPLIMVVILNRHLFVKSAR